MVWPSRTRTVEGMSDANSTRQRPRRIGVGMVIGVVIGAALGLGVGGVFFENPFLGMAFGIAIGVGIGVALNYGDANRPSAETSEPAPGPGLPDRSDAGLEDAGLGELIDEGSEEPVRPVRRAS